MGRRLGKLRTIFGERSVLDAAAQCSRCGYCEQACPSYAATGRESFSPRGRNQIVRLLLEEKLGRGEGAWEALSTCLLCGACQSACYAAIPTAEIVLEGRRLLAGQSLPWAGRRLLKLLARRPRTFARALKAAFALKREGILERAAPLLRLLGLGRALQAAERLGEPPASFLEERLERRRVPGAAWSYFAACGPNYLFPEAGRASNAVLSSALGPGAVLGNGCCGLASYNYGALDDARALARKNIALFEGGEGPVAADCSSCAAFLKGYPGLFPDEPEVRARAEAFSARVRDFVELASGLAPGARPGAAPQETVTFHESCRARHGSRIPAPEALLKSLLGPRFVPIPEPDACCGGAGAYSFIHPEIAESVLERKIGNIASTGASLVLASSTSCLLELAWGLRKYYSAARAMHLSEFMKGLSGEWRRA